MADQAVNEMISAYAAGCMDKENLTHFVNYVKNKGELPYKDLGKMQTLISMLPIILEQEQPSLDTKNKVARALIAMQDEIKEKIKIERDKTIYEAKQQEVKEEPAAPKEEPAVIEQPEPPRKENRVSEPAEQPKEIKIENPYMNNNRLFTDAPPRPAAGPSLTPIWIIIALLFLAIGGIAYYSYSNIKSLKESVGKTESSLALVKGELRNASEYINRNSALVDFFNYENVWMVSMTGVDPTLKIAGRLYVASAEKEVLMQINNLPTPSPENIYQLWVVTKQQTYPVGNFFVEPSSRYVKMANLPQIAKEQIERFQITLEPRSGSPLPGGIIYAVGIVNESAAKPGRRK